MQVDRQEIVKKVEDRTYFSEGLEWFNDIDLNPVSERSYLLLAAIISVTIFCISILNLVEVIKVQDRVPVTLYSDDITDYYRKIIPLAKEGVSSQESVTSYLIDDFIQARENYYPTLTKDDLEFRKRKIKNLATKSIYNDYLRYVHKSNRNSPLHRFKEDKSRIIVIDKIEYDDDSPFSGRAKISFTATVQSLRGEKPEASHWVADIQYRLQDIEVIASTGTPLRFKVLYYKVAPRK